MEENIKKNKLWEVLSKATEISVMGFLASLVLSTAYTYFYFTTITGFDFKHFPFDMIDVLKTAFFIFPLLIIWFIILSFLVKILYLPQAIYLIIKKKDVTLENMYLYHLIIALIIIGLSVIALMHEWNMYIFAFSTAFIFMIDLLMSSVPNKPSIKRSIIMIVYFACLLGLADARKEKSSGDYLDHIVLKENCAESLDNIKIVQTINKGIVFLEKEGDVKFISLDNVLYYSYGSKKSREKADKEIQGSN